MKTLEEAISWAAERVGIVGLPQEWTPSNWTVTNPYDNDCALFQSQNLFGDQRFYIVSQFANYFPDSNGSVGDLACFRWPGSTSNYDHIGIVTSPPDRYGNFTTIEANTSGPASQHQVARKIRNTANVVRFVRPNYSASIAGGNATPIQEEETMTPEQAQKLDAIYDALFKNTPVQLPGRSATPGGSLANESVLLDVAFAQPSDARPYGGLFSFMNIIIAKVDRIISKLGA